MIRNMGMLDRTLRVFFGAILIMISWPFLDVIPGTVLSCFCLIFGVINIVSSLMCWCFMYSIFEVSTKGDE